MKHNYLLTYCLFFFYFLSLFHQPAEAQSKKFIKAYNQLKTSFLEGNYKQSLTMFDKLLALKENVPNLADAYMYKALALIKSDKDFDAQTVLNELLQKFPAYKNKDDVFYQLAHYHFQQRAWAEGFSYVQAIKDTALLAQATTMKKYFLQSESLPTLKQLQQKFLQEKDIAQLIVNKIATQSDSLDDYFLAENLINVFNLARPLRQKVMGVSYTKPHYTIGILLPIELKNLKFGSKNSLFTDLSIALYQGMRVALKELEEQKGKITLKVYDVRTTEKDSLEKLLKSEEFKQLDFIVGGLQEEVLNKIAPAIEKEQIYLINPLSEESSWIKNKYVFLSQSTFSSRGKYVATFAKNQFLAKKVLIIYDNLAKNKATAEAHKQQAEKLGMQISAYEQIGANNANKLKEILANVNPTEIGYIFASSTSQVVANKILEYVESTKINCPIITSEAWLRFQDDELIEKYQKNNFYFFAPEYVEVDKPTEEKFKKQYFLATRSTPAAQDKKIMPFAHLGYDLMYFITQILKNNGIKGDYRLPALAKNLFYEGKISNKIDLREGNDNQYVNILKYENGQMKKVDK